MLEPGREQILSDEDLVGCKEEDTVFTEATWHGTRA